MTNHLTEPEPWPAPPRLSRLHTSSSLTILARGLYLVSGGCIILAVYCIIPFFQPKAEQEPIDIKPPHHYRYVLPFLVPVTAWFAIANWIGWQFYLNAEVDEKLVACGSSSSGSTKKEKAAEE